jgi:dethiobiotin synthetase
MTSLKGFFITGTDTEVGKTLIAGALILRLQNMGIKTVGYKPVAAGIQEVNGKLINEDIQTLLMVSQSIDPHLKPIHSE